MELIKISSLNLKYGEKVVFNDFNLIINEGDKLLITGKSGIGKSSLFKIILGFETNYKGEILYKNKKIEDINEIRNDIAFVNQSVTLRPTKCKTLLKEISEFSNNNFDGKINKKLADMFDFDLSLLDKKTTELSGGERQRLGIIIAISLDRSIYMLDEVTSALDSKLKKKVVDYFSNCDKTVIVISHDIEFENNIFRKVEL